MFLQIAAPAIVMLEQQLCRSGNIHGEESTGWKKEGKGRGCRPAHARGVLIYACVPNAMVEDRPPIESTGHQPTPVVMFGGDLKTVEAAKQPCSHRRGATFFYPSQG